MIGTQHIEDPVEKPSKKSEKDLSIIAIVFLIILCFGGLFSISYSIVKNIRTCKTPSSRITHDTIKMIVHDTIRIENTPITYVCEGICNGSSDFKAQNP